MSVKSSAMTRGRKWAAAAVVILLALSFAAATLPARVAWQLLQGRIPNVALSGLSGTLWAGRAQTLALAKQSVGRLSWQLPALSALSLAPKMRFKLEGDTLNIEGAAQRSGGQIVLSALTASANASWLQAALGIPALIPTGTLAANFGELALDARGLPLRARGNIQWLQAGVTGMAQAEFGSFDIALSNAPAGGIVGVVTPIGKGAINISGGFTLVGENYTAELTLRPTTSEVGIARALALIGQPLDAAGSTAGARLLKIKGAIVLGTSDLPRLPGHTN
jgi:general secretion pathway protein N